MVRNYKRKTPQKYNKKDVENAVEFYLRRRPEGEDPPTIAEVARQFRIPRQTLSDHVNAARKSKDRRIGAGRPTVLPAVVEQYLVDGVVTAAQLGWPLNRPDIKEAVRIYCQRMKVTAFDGKHPGKDWMTAFCARWKSKLSVRQVETLTKARASGLTRDVRDHFFEALNLKLIELGIKDHRGRIFNLDETGLCTKASASGYFFKRGTREAQMVAPTEGKATYTVLFTCSAAGDFLPPFVVYKGTHLHDTWMSGGPEGTVYNVTKSGWMEDYVFESWFKSSFLPYLEKRQIQRPVILFFDGHGSHITYTFAQSAKENGVCLYCIPPHSSSKLQPLDVGVYGPAKKAWRNILQKFYRESQLQNITKAIFPTLLKQLFDNMVRHPGNVVEAFRACGLCPFNPTAISDSMLSISEVYEPNVSADAGTPVAGPSGEASSMEAQQTTDEVEQPGTSQMSAPVAPPKRPLFGPSPIEEVDKTSNPSPHKLMRRALCAAITPPASKDTITALARNKKRRRRVQKEFGECLTEQDSMERLHAEDQHRKEKGKGTSAGRGKRTKGVAVRKGRPGKRLSYPASEPVQDDCPVTSVEPDSAAAMPELASTPGSVSRHSLIPFDIHTYSIDKIVAAVYDDEWYLAVCTEQNGGLGEVHVSFMEPPGPNPFFKWPFRKDECILPVKDILAVVTETLEPTSSRAVAYRISDECQDQISNALQNYKDMNNK